MPKVSSESIVSVLHLDASNSSEYKELLNSINEEREQNKTERKAIPVPKISTCTTPTFDHGRSTFKLPDHYIKFAGCTGAKLIHSKRDLYNLRQCDMEWLEKHRNPPPGYRPVTLTELKMSQVILHFEQQAFRKGGTKTEVLTHYNAKQAAAEAQLMFDLEAYSSTLLYHYWRQMRNKLKKPLMRKFQPTPEIGNEDPNIPFRSRDIGNKKMTTRRTSRSARKQADENLSRIVEFQTQLRDAMKVLDIVEKRELIKTEAYQTNSTLIKKYLMDTRWGKTIRKSANQSAPNTKALSSRELVQILQRQHKVRSLKGYGERFLKRRQTRHSKFNPSELWSIPWHNLPIEDVSDDEDAPCPEFYEKLPADRKIEMQKYMTEHRTDKHIVANMRFKFDLSGVEVDSLVRWFENNYPAKEDFYNRLEAENRLTRKERIETILNPDLELPNRNLFAQRPSRLGRIAFDVVVVEETETSDEELENIEPLGTKLEDIEKQRNNVFFNLA